MTQATLADVAVLAGVSVSTASRALSGARNVTPRNQRLVEKASRELGYRHNPLAGALRTQRSGSIGVLLPRFSSGFLASLVESVSIALDSQGRTLTLRYTQPGASGAVDAVRALRDRRVDGIIVCAPSPAVAVAAAGAVGDVPFVLVGRHHEAVFSDSVGLDDERAAALLIEHLAPVAPRVVTVGFAEALPADERRRSLLEIAARQRGLRVGTMVPCESTLEGGIGTGAHLQELIETGPRTSLVCANDDVALGVHAALEMRGVHAPDDVRIASLMDVTFSDPADRQITTLRHPWPQMGAEAARILDEVLADRSEDTKRPPRRIVLSPTLLPGRSTALQTHASG